MNQIGDGDMDYLMSLFADGASCRQAAKEVGVALNTALRYQRIYKRNMIEMFGSVHVNTGRRANGSMASYETMEMRPNWITPTPTTPCSPTTK